MKKWFALTPNGDTVGPCDTEDEARKMAVDKMATDPPVSEAQRKAMHAAAEGHSTLGIPKSVGTKFSEADPGGSLPERAGDDAIKGHAAGIMFVAPDGDILLLRRSGDEANFPGHWAWPGGKLNPGESPLEGAKREAKEEMGDAIPNGPVKHLDSRRTPRDPNFAFHTFVQPVGSKFIPRLNGEHSGYAWSPMHQLPAPLHPGVHSTLSEQLMAGKTSGDMTPDDWKGLKAGFLQWMKEEEQEAEHQGKDERGSQAWMQGHQDAQDGKQPRPPKDAQGSVDYTNGYEEGKKKKKPGAMDSMIAFDKDTVRSYDRDGRLHVSMTPISKANICEYYGNEIPNAETLGLEPNRKYKLFRHPDELAKAAKTFNNLPLLSKHVPITSDTHNSGLVIGSTGTDAEFKDPYLLNSLVIWPQDAIDDVESEDKRELSCAYHYLADMTPGTYMGEPYEGVMRNIIGNHVALVKAGRAGSDVMVMDSKPERPITFDAFKVSKMDFSGFKPDHISFDAFKPQRISFDAFKDSAKSPVDPEGTNQPSVLNKGQPWTHNLRGGKDAQYEVGDKVLYGRDPRSSGFKLDPNNIYTVTKVEDRGGITYVTAKRSTGSTLSYPASAWTPYH